MDYEHLYDTNQPGVLDVYRRWRRLVEPYDGLLLGEVYLLSAEQLARYVAAEDGLHLAFWFKPLHMDWDPATIRSVLRAAADAAPDQLAWVSGSHDRSRAVSRFGGGDIGRRRALALSTLLFGLPGTPFLYQGEELGLDNGVVPREDAQDPVARRTASVGRDGARTPMPWAPGPGAGLHHRRAALAAPGRADGRGHRRGAARRSRVDAAHLPAARRAAQRHPDLHAQPVDWIGEDGPVVSYQRGGVLVAANCGDAAGSLAVPDGEWTVAFPRRARAKGPPRTARSRWRRTRR